ncbi:unnamed protein product [Allacma fusca]|uniref:Uncharacterized protein n=1 Tax=Allacma fusca TaxID=39272 RepID=A0A8J2KFZ7_9HEXA|nr:unnamed protein product [Allacma fusca]
MAPQNQHFQVHGREKCLDKEVIVEPGKNPVVLPKKISQHRQVNRVKRRPPSPSSSKSRSSRKTQQSRKRTVGRKH